MAAADHTGRGVRGAAEHSRVPAGARDVHARTGYYPLPPWGGLAVLCAYAAAALALAMYLLRRRPRHPLAAGGRGRL
ncbi:hypothetical protein [Amycolatopsis thermoflava]|uniref:hypothetical protein n=1 Tax=Amycolatopsis thermoflava TaxID=84480 RepID=UPI003D73B9DE